MMKRGMVMLATMVAAMFFLVPLTANAVVTYTFTDEINGPGTDNYGTISWTTSGTDVIVDVVLADPDWRIQVFGFNYDGTPAPGTFSITGSTITYDPNSVKADGYGDADGSFDLVVPANGGGVLGTNSFSGTLALTPGDITENDFNVLDETSVYYAFVHIGNFPSQAGSIWVGATGAPPPPPPRVPEPGTLLLLGSGLAGLAILRRKVRA